VTSLQILKFEIRIDCPWTIRDIDLKTKVKSTHFKGMKFSGFIP